MSLIQMSDGKLFTVTESAEEVMQAIGEFGGQGRRPIRPGSETPGFARLTTMDELPIYVNVEHVAMVTESAS